ncbi:ISAzo13-like element transposase-related protein [Phormidesmis priestleyi]|uniref:ISAzo13-like element transposase-related protein n=1 Tax=Phormidesmis priestleyi TaxID=268141 RepID=UPI000A6A8BCA|nr:transposase [Phormidesmis priestleyi]
MASLQDGWNGLTLAQQQATDLLQLKVDNKPESSGVRTQFLKRMVELANQMGQPIPLLYYPPYPSKYNPIERCWGTLEQHWKDTQLSNVQVMLAWAQSITWKGIHPTVKLNSTTYPKGISLTKPAMREIESRLERSPELPKWDILIRLIDG